VRDLAVDRIGSDLARPNRFQVGDVEPSIYSGDKVEATEAEALAGDEGNEVDVERRHQAC